MRVSIITVTYNSAITLPDTLRSVSEQTYRDLEHIIVDGASTDGTQAIIESYVRSQPNVRYISEKDTGIYNAINKGIWLATGDIIGVLNSDDVFAASDTVATIARTFSEKSAEVVYGDLVYCNSDNTIVRYWKSNDFERSKLRFGWMPAHPTFYCMKNIYEQVGLYDETFRISADYDFMLRVLVKPYCVCYIPKVLIRMGIGGASNRDCRAMMSKSREDVRALHKNHIGAGILTVFVKNIRKIYQFMR